MTTIIDYALFAGAAYYDTRAGINRFPPPQNWSVYSRFPSNEPSGFEATAFQKGNEIVISYAGTDFSHPSSDFLHGNIPLTKSSSPTLAPISVTPAVIFCTAIFP